MTKREPTHCIVLSTGARIPVQAITHRDRILGCNVTYYRASGWINAYIRQCPIPYRTVEGSEVVERWTTEDYRPAPELRVESI